MIGYRVESSGRTYATLEAARADLKGLGLGVESDKFRDGRGSGLWYHTIFDDYFGGPVDRLIVVESGQ